MTSLPNATATRQFGETGTGSYRLAPTRITEHRLDQSTSHGKRLDGVGPRADAKIRTMQIVMQWVRTSWTKDSRGDAAATVRNAAPIGFELPETDRSFVHEVTLSESSGFRPCSTVRDLPLLQPRTNTEGVSLVQTEGRLRVLPTIPTFWNIPPRQRRPPAARLKPGQWIRWQLNYRFSSVTGTNDWSYHLHTLNLAYGTVEPDTFLGAPTLYVDERGSLR